MPFFVIRAIFLFLPRDLSIISLVANAPGEIRGVSMVTAPKYSDRFAAGVFTDFDTRRISECCWCHSPESTQVSGTEANSEVPWLEIPAQYKGRSLLSFLFTLNRSIS